MFWPRLDRVSSPETETHLAELNASITQIESLQFGDAIASALASAERIYGEENDRSKTADNKAFQYLLVAAAIISLLTYLESSIWDGKLGTAPKWLSLLILLVAVLYLVRAALWALKAVSSRTYYVVGSDDVAHIWAVRSPETKLTRELLIATLKNQDGINAKVSAVKMATAFLSRTIAVFGLLLTVQICWEIWGSIGLPSAVFIKQHICQIELLASKICR